MIGKMRCVGSFRIASQPHQRKALHCEASNSASVGCFRRYEYTENGRRIQGLEANKTEGRDKRGPEGLSPNSPAFQGQVNDYKSPPNPVPQNWGEGSVRV